MSFLKKVILKKKKDAKPISLSDAILKLKESEETLLEKQNYLEGKIEIEIKNAKIYVNKNKKAALQALHKKKKYEKQLQQIDGMLSTIEMKRDALESANININTFSSMQNADQALKAANKFLNTDDVHKILNDLTDHRHLAEDISDAISNPVSWSIDELDDEELANELDELELDDLNNEKLLPNIPINDIDSDNKILREKGKNKPQKASAI